MKRWLLRAVLGTGLLIPSAPVAAQSMTAAQPVLVRFENLLWVYARSGLPTRVAGRTLVPLVEGCELLGLDCKAAGEEAQVQGQTLPITSGTAGPLIELSVLAQAAHLTLRYDAASRMAVLPVPSSAAVRSLLAELNNLNTMPTAPTQPLSLTLGAVKSGSPARRLSLNLAGASRFTFSLVAAVPSAITLTGDGLHGSADVKPGPPACAGTACVVGLDRSSRYALALLGTR
ncbi:hypothetical protein MF271_13175 [Deinococcus sp. KNUC1210]|uniref:hypothetical protein n=1 Tax=Deinococcus sp. KNUC1210 TaxID=2917691 RepID=UPI001EF0A5F3|nr:hypothetical protein [Deinococcus sp. KNUC1210]ULH14917.1 hypothetical protein MF271_13175 [Deinococcus sp. KNUC1210]